MKLSFLGKVSQLKQRERKKEKRNKTRIRKALFQLASVRSLALWDSAIPLSAGLPCPLAVGKQSDAVLFIHVGLVDFCHKVIVTTGNTRQAHRNSPYLVEVCSPPLLFFLPFFFFFPKFLEARRAGASRNRLEKGDVVWFPLYCEVTCIKGSNL